MRVLSILFCAMLPLFAHAAAFTTVGSMATARNEFTTTLLPSGKVLVTGGIGNTDTTKPFATCELFDPVTNTWSPAASLATGRRGHTATLLPNGKVFVFGGVSPTDATLSTGELYDPVANTWSASANAFTVRVDHTATLLQNGKVLIAGGSGDEAFLSSVQFYDPASDKFSAAASMTGGRSGHTATLLKNGNLLVSGGQNFASSPATLEMYDVSTNKWIAAGKLSKAIDFYPATLLSSGEVLITGGAPSLKLATDAADIYSPATNTVAAAGTLFMERSFHAAVALANGKVLLTGGTNKFETYVANAEVYDPATGTFSSAGFMNLGRSNHTAILLNNGKVLIVGGDGDFQVQASAELYDPSVPAFTSGPLASPNPATIKDTLTFFADGESFAGPVSITWDFGDGTKGSGSQVTHKYAAEGVYSAKCTASDGTASDTVSVKVIVGPGDGTPFMTVSKASIKLSFVATGKPMDTIAFSGTIQLPDGFSLDGKTMFLNVAGFTAKADLTATGISDHNSLTKVSVKGNTAKYSLNSGKRLIVGTEHYGFVDADVTKQPIPTVFTITIGDLKLQAVKTLIYSAKHLKGGSAK